MTSEEVLEGIKHVLVAAIFERMINAQTDDEKLTAEKVRTALKTAVQEESNWKIIVHDVDNFEVELDFTPDADTTITAQKIKDRFYRELTGKRHDQ